MKNKHIDWTQGLKYDHKVWPWHGRISGMGGPFDIEQKTCESVIHDNDHDQGEV